MLDKRRPVFTTCLNESELTEPDQKKFKPIRTFQPLNIIRPNMDSLAHIHLTKMVRDKNGHLRILVDTANLLRPEIEAAFLEVIGIPQVTNPCSNKNAKSGA